ncbi:hypothetical protein KB20921_10660 [Edwardsiella ictaluri]|uniref:Uncharacterized protein n=1 Tax=Edwardsiella ictaluri (strain 93-146) TaxID=634503 RepID=C5BHL6_EDWI9|nr:hypothetical protein NT01EI_1150 [Edwardsiella ictaluri 93-146]BEH98305.1 hypothetical protein KH20906_10330 [Edwardsiella ictaluri]BEI01805.1 hypothetical protein KB20921_10660 [Edwardsiella ictaluri]BEI05273.1 hypothetical protein KH201010_10590 [Edwardsiella ictaluri]BEI08731.1 hypothetical protein STU22726_10620 [Edwardsiella ictaluri]
MPVLFRVMQQNEKLHMPLLLSQYGTPRIAATKASCAVCRHAFTISGVSIILPVD